MQLIDTVTGHFRTRDRRAARTAAVLAALVGVAVLVAACGGGTDSPGVVNVEPTSASRSSSSTASASAAADAGGGPSAGIAGNPRPDSSSGGGNQGGVALAGSRQAALRFSACMRVNGEPNFPDPNAAGVIQAAVDPNSPQLKEAMKRCAKYRTNGGQPTGNAPKTPGTLAEALAFSKCMRSHGVTTFPDPTTSGGTVRLGVGRGPGAGDLNPNAPLFQHAQRVCRSLVPGVPGSTGSK